MDSGSKFLDRKILSAILITNDINIYTFRLLLEGSGYLFISKLVHPDQDTLLRVFNFILNLDQIHVLIIPSFKLLLLVRPEQEVILTLFFLNQRLQESLFKGFVDGAHFGK